MKIRRPQSVQPMPKNAKRVFKGVIFEVYQWKQKLFNGEKAIFEKLKRPDTVVIFAVLPNGKIILARQRQPGKGLFISALGGRVDEGEEILEAAKRELLEESGYEAKKFILWDAQQPVGKIDWSVYTFIAKGLKKISNPNLDGGEKINLKPVTFDELIELGTNKRFSEKEIIFRLLEAKLDQKKKAKLKKLFDPRY